MSPRERRRSLLDPSPSRWDLEIESVGGEPYTRFNRDQLYGMMRSTRLLEQLLDRANRDDLPALGWTVTQFAVTGELSLLDSRTPVQRREVFMAWVDAIGAEWRELRREYDGSVELRGHVKVPAPGAPHLEVTVGLVATWYVDEDTEPVTVPTDTAGQPE